MRSPRPPLPPAPPAAPPFPVFSPYMHSHQHSAAIAPPESEGKHFSKYRSCVTFRGASLCGIEADEWTLVRAFVTPENTVLELGARYGTTSCVLSQMTNNSGFVASVEIDSTVYADLLHNRALHHCNFLIVYAAVTQSSLFQYSRSDAYGNRALDCHNSSVTGTRCTYSGATRPENTYAERLRRGLPRPIPTVSFEAVEQQLGRPIDTLLIDCEGCISSLLDNQLHILRGIKLILIEHDMIPFVDYDKWFRLFRREGFERIWHIRDSYDHRPHGQFAWWSTRLEHSAWMRVGSASRGVVPCTQYKVRMNLTDAELMCK